MFKKWWLRGIATGLVVLFVLSALPVLPVQAQGSWWNSSWTHRRVLTFDNTASAEDLVNFPVLVKLDSTRIDYSYTQNSGQDIRFVDSDDTTLLSHEIESWDETGTSWVWVNVPQIDSGSTTDFIWMYYGNASASDGQDAEGTWNSSYVMVQHLKDLTTSTTEDSTSYGNDGAKTAANEPIEIASQIYRGQDFDGTNDYINIPYNAAYNTPNGLTVESWMTIDSGSDSWNYPISRGGAYWDAGGSWGLSSNSTAITLYFWIRNATDDGWQIISKAVTASTLYYVVGIWDTNNISLYLNGGLQAGPAALTSIQSNTLPIRIGTRANSLTGFVNGLFDEVRISDMARSADWIEAQYLSMTDSYITFGSEEYVPANPPTGLILTQVADYQVDASWTAGVGNANFMLRRKLGEYPADRTDGVSVYEGAGTSVSDTASDVGLELDKYTYYYRVWAQSGLGIWSDPAEENIGGGTMLLIAFLGFGLVLTLLELKFHFLPIALAASASWLVPGFLLLTSPTTIGIGTMDEGYVQVLGFVLILLVFVPIGHFLMMMGKEEITVTDGKKTYRMWGKRPEEKVESRSTRVKRERKGKLQSIRARHRG